MIDIKVMQESFLCQWLSKLSRANTSSKWTWVPSKLFSLFGKDYACFSSTIGPSNFKGLNLVSSKFWKSVLSTWLSNNRQTTHKFGYTMCIWNNADITYQGKVLYFQKWAEKGITYLTDILHNNAIMSYHTVQTILGSYPGLHMEYMVVFAAVSAFLKHNRVETAIQNETRQLLFNGENLNSARAFRKHIVESRYSPPCAQNFWKNKFDIKISEKHWMLARNTTKESRLIELQWKILHNVHPTNILLEKMGLVQSNVCSLCSTETDFVEHFFFECIKIKPLWEHVTQLVKTKYNKTLSLQTQHVLLGITKHDSFTKHQLRYINHVILIAKMCVRSTGMDLL